MLQEQILEEKFWCQVLPLLINKSVFIEPVRPSDCIHVIAKSLKWEWTKEKRISQAE